MRGNFSRMSGANRSRMRLEAGVDLPLAAARADDRVELGVARLADGHSRAVVQHHVELVDVVDGLAAHQRVDAARVVADHAAERAAAVRGRIGRERQLMHFCGVTHAIEHDARLHARDLPRRIERDDAVQVFREVHDDRDVAALAGEARARAARQDRRARFAARRDRGDDVGFVERNDEPDGNLAIVRRVGRVERARAGVEAHFAAHGLLQRALERLRFRERYRAHARESWEEIQRAPGLRERLTSRPLRWPRSASCQYW